MTSLTSLLSRLEVYSEAENHEEVYQTSLDYLKGGNAFSLDALKQCLVALIKLDKYETAYELIKKYASEFEVDSLVLERAYVYYKIGDDVAIKELLSNVTSSSRGFKHILAQHFYKSGQAEKSLNLYQELLSQRSVEDSDLSVNERAAIYQATESASLQELSAKSSDNLNSYDLQFNDSLIELSKGNLEESLNLLEQSYEKCQQATSDFPQEDKIAEITPIIVQKAYIYHLLGKTEESLSILNSIDLSLIDDNVLKTIIKTNKLSIDSNGKTGVFQYDQLSLPNSISLASKRLPLPSLKTLQRNDLILAFLAGKDVMHSSLKHISNFPGSDLAYALSLLNKSGASVEEGVDADKLFKFARSTDIISINLLATSLLVEAEKPEKAALLLEKIINANDENLTHPVVVSVLLSLYDILDRSSAKLSLLNRAYDALLMKEVFTLEDVKFIKVVAFSFISFDYEKAENLFAKISQYDTLVSQIEGTTSSSSLPAAEDLTVEVDTDELISLGVAPLLSSRKKQTTTNRFSSIKKQRVRKQRRLPKSTIAKIDPERWLPLKDRSYYKAKKGKKNMKDTQGGATDRASEQALNISNTTPSSGSTPTPSSKSASKSSAKKTNKKKGRK